MYVGPRPINSTCALWFQPCSSKSIIGYVGQFRFCRVIVDVFALEGAGHLHGRVGVNFLLVFSNSLLGVLD